MVFSLFFSVYTSFLVEAFSHIRSEYLHLEDCFKQFFFVKFYFLF